MSIPYDDTSACQDTVVDFLLHTASARTHLTQVYRPDDHSRAENHTLVRLTGARAG